MARLVDNAYSAFAVEKDSWCSGGYVREGQAGGSSATCRRCGRNGIRAVVELNSAE